MAVIRSRYKCKKDRRKKSKVKRWSKPRSMQKLVEPEFTVLPTRQTLTYAEAQKFVDVLHNGQVNRLNISDNIEILDSEAVIENIEGELSTNNNQFQDDSNPSKYLFSSKCSLINEDISEQNARAFKLPKYYVRTAAEEEENDEEQYDADEEDLAWLQLLNANRKEKKLLSLSMDTFEYVMDLFEKEAYNIMAITSEVLGLCDEQNSLLSSNQNKLSSDIKALMTSNHPEICCICRESKTGLMNGLLKCDNCGLLVHQDCYGVPFQTEGIWLCKKCLKSPNSPVKCCLCPCSGRGSFGRVGGGAMKQTDDGKWVHILCALFIPEVTFGSNVYLEPVERISKVPQWRRQLRCSGCSRVGRGACLGCQAPGCVKAFHALCAIQKKCYLKIISTSLPSTTINGFKTKKSELYANDSENIKCFTSKRTGDRRTRIFYCYRHLHLAKNQSKLSYNSQLSPDKKDKIKLPLSSNNSNSEKIKIPLDNGKKLQRNASFELSYDGAYAKFKRYKRRKKPLSNEHHDHLNLPLSVPSLPHACLSRISSTLSDRDNERLVEQLHTYWKLKRSSRQGIPLVQKFYQMLLTKRRLSKSMVVTTSHASSNLMDRVRYDWLKKWRRSYEKVRLLLELVRKREKMKLEMLKLKEASYQMLINPRNLLLQQLIKQLKSKDMQGWFHYPVTEVEAPGYHSIIKNPMCYEDMITKINNHQYISFQQLRDDFELIISNCLQYNQQGSVLHDLALKHQKQCSSILDTAEKVFVKGNFCIDTGLHNKVTNADDVIHKAQETCEGSVNADAIKTDKLNKNNNKASKELPNFYSVHDMNLYIHNFINPNEPYKETIRSHTNLSDLSNVNNMAENIRENRNIFNNKIYETNKNSKLHKANKKESVKIRKYGNLDAPCPPAKHINNSPFQPTYECHKSIFKSRKSLIFTHKTTNTAASNHTDFHNVSKKGTTEVSTLKEIDDDTVIINNISCKSYNTTIYSSSSNSPTYDSAEDTIINSSDTPINNTVDSARKFNDTSNNKSSKSISCDEDTQNDDNDYDTQNDTEVLSDNELNKTFDKDKTILINDQINRTIEVDVLQYGEVNKIDDSTTKSGDSRNGVVFYDAASEFARPLTDEASKADGVLGNTYNINHRKKHTRKKNKKKDRKRNVITPNGEVASSVMLNSHMDVNKDDVDKDTTVENTGCNDDTIHVNSDQSCVIDTNEATRNINSEMESPMVKNRPRSRMNHFDSIEFILLRIRELEKKIASSDSIKYNYKFHIVKMCNKEISRLKAKMTVIRKKEKHQKEANDVHLNDEDVVVDSNGSSAINLSTHNISINNNNNSDINHDTSNNTNDDNENINNTDEGNKDNSSDGVGGNINGDNKDNNDEGNMGSNNISYDGNNNDDNVENNDIEVNTCEPDSTADSSNDDLEGGRSLRSRTLHAKTAVKSEGADPTSQRYHMRNHNRINKKINRSLCFYQLKQHTANRYNNLLKKSQRVIHNSKSNDVASIMKTTCLNGVESNDSEGKGIGLDKCEENVVESTVIVNDKENVDETKGDKDKGQNERENNSIGLFNPLEGTSYIIGISSAKKHKKRKSLKRKSKKGSKASLTLPCGLLNDTTLVISNASNTHTALVGAGLEDVGDVVKSEDFTHDTIQNGKLSKDSGEMIANISCEILFLDECTKKGELSKDIVSNGATDGKDVSEEEEALERRVTRSSMRSATSNNEASVHQNQVNHKRNNLHQNSVQEILSNVDVNVRRSKRLNSGLYGNPIVSLGNRVDSESINVSTEDNNMKRGSSSVEDGVMNEETIINTSADDINGGSTVVEDAVNVDVNGSSNNVGKSPPAQKTNENNKKDNMVTNESDSNHIDGNLNGEIAVGIELNGRDSVVEENEKTITCDAKNHGEKDGLEMMMRLMRKKRLQEDVQTNTEPCKKKAILKRSDEKDRKTESRNIHDVPNVIKKGSVVWAKSRGYIWYPALVIYAPISDSSHSITYPDTAAYNNLQSFDCLSPIRKNDGSSQEMPSTDITYNNCLSPVVKCLQQNNVTSTPYFSRKSISNLQNGHLNEAESDGKEEGNCINDPEIPTETKDNTTENNSQLFLLRFYDKKRNLQWLERERLVVLGVDEEADDRFLNTARSWSSKKYLRRAYGIALKKLQNNSEADDTAKNQNSNIENSDTRENECLPEVNGNVIKCGEVVNNSKEFEDKTIDNRVGNNIVENGNYSPTLGNNDVVDKNSLENIGECKETLESVSTCCNPHEKLMKRIKDASSENDVLRESEDTSKEKTFNHNSQILPSINSANNDLCHHQNSLPSFKQPQSPTTQPTSSPFYLSPYNPIVTTSDNYDKSRVLETAISQMAPLFNNASVESCTYLPKPQEKFSHYLGQLHKSGHFKTQHQYPSTEQFLNKRHHCLPHFPV